MPATQRILISERGLARVIQFIDRRLFDEDIVREVGEQLQAALPRTEKTPVVLDFSGVEIISSSMLVKFLLLQRQADAAGAVLR